MKISRIVPWTALAVALAQLPVPSQESGALGPVPAAAPPGGTSGASASGDGEESGGADGDLASPPPVRPIRAGPETASKARDELLDLERRLRAVEKRTQEQRRTSARRLEDLAFEKTVASRAVEVARRELDRREKEFAQKKEREAKETRESARLAEESQGLLEPIRQFLSRIETHIDAGIPWRIAERKRSVLRLRDAIENDGLGPAEALTALGRIQESEESLGRWIEPGAVQLEVQGEPRALSAFRFGLLGIGFTSDDHSHAGFIARGDSPETALEAATKTDADRFRLFESYTTALDVLWGRDSPKVLDLFVPKLPLAVEEAR